MSDIENQQPIAPSDIDVSGITAPSISPSPDATGAMPGAPVGAWRMPAEWEPHDATWIAWPHHEPDWPGKFEPIPWVYAEIVRALGNSELVEIVCHDETVREDAVACLEMHGVPAEHFRLHVAPTDRVWLRDSGPTGVQDDTGLVSLVRWDFNAWAKYDNFANDQHIPEVVHTATGLPLVPASAPIPAHRSCSRAVASRRTVLAPCW